MKKRQKRRPRCAYCKRTFTPPKRGRPPLYCSGYHRQLAYQVRRAMSQVPLKLLQRDIDSIHSKEGFKRAVVGVLREIGILPPAPRSPPPLRLID